VGLTGNRPTAEPLETQSGERFRCSAGDAEQALTIVPASETIVVRTGFGPWVMSDLLGRVFDALGVDAPTRMAMEVDDQAGG